jgi:hypothetical protein
MAPELPGVSTRAGLSWPAISRPVERGPVAFPVSLVDLRAVGSDDVGGISDL